jgi:hypothetical protein
MADKTCVECGEAIEVRPWSEAECDCPLCDECFDVGRHLGTGCAKRNPPDDVRDAAQALVSELRAELAEQPEPVCVVPVSLLREARALCIAYLGEERPVSEIGYAGELSGVCLWELAVYAGVAVGEADGSDFVRTCGGLRVLDGNTISDPTYRVSYNEEFRFGREVVMVGAIYPDGYGTQREMFSGDGDRWSECVKRLNAAIAESVTLPHGPVENAYSKDTRHAP